MEDHWIALLAICSSIAIGLMAIFLPLWVRGESERRKYLDRKIEKEDAKLHKRIDNHVHEKLCDERSGEIKKDIEGLKGAK
jgi:hypothetical protein